MNAIVDVIPSRSIRSGTEITKTRRVALREATRSERAKMGVGSRGDVADCHPILTRLRHSTVLDHEHQRIVLRRHYNACLDMDWIMALSRVTADHIRAVMERFDDEDFRLSDFFHMDKKPGGTRREDTAARRRETLKAKYVTLCEAYLDTHEAHENMGDMAMRPDAIQNIAKAFRAIGVHSTTRSAIINGILNAGEEPTACRKARSLAIMLRQAMAEADSARAIIESSNQRLVLSIARKLRTLAPDMEVGDLLAEGQFGLRRAIEKFEPELGNKFTTYAVWWIRQSILRAIKDRSSLIRIPSHIQEKARKNSDSASERHALPDIVSLHEPLAGSPDRTLCDVLPDLDGADTEQEMLHKQTREVLAKAMARLSDRERFVILHRFGLRSREMDVGAIAAKLDLSKERVRQIERDALRKLASCRGVAELRP